MLTTAKQTTHIKNECGGDRVLSETVGSPCNPGMYSGCETGVLACRGLDALICLPRCENSKTKNDIDEVKKITCGHDDEQINKNKQDLIDSMKEVKFYKSEHEKLLSEKNSQQSVFCNFMDCGRYGVCNEQLKKCVCDKGYSGTSCDKHNPCEVDDDLCGSHGICVSYSSGSYQCECDEGYTGKTCETDLSCQPGGVMISGKCSCDIGYTGNKCDHCEKDSLCVPTNVTNDPFILIHAPKDIRKEMLENDPPPGYDYGPIEPNTLHKGKLYNCQCKAVKTIQGENIKLKEGYIYFDDYYYQPRQPYNARPSNYLHDYYRNYRFGGPYTYYYGGGGLVLFLFVTIFFMIMIFWWPCMESSNTSSSNQTHNTTVNQHHVNVSSRYPNHRPLNLGPNNNMSRQRQIFSQTHYNNNPMNHQLTDVFTHNNQTRLQHQRNFIQAN
jgi:hypothetical protein